MKSRLLRHAALAAVLCGGSWLSHAQGIYTCVDAKGRKLTSDRPIAECLDREQRELNSQGATMRRVPPNMTAAERGAQEERARRAQEEAERATDERRRDRALVARYPNQAAHDKERAAALKQIDESIANSASRATELAKAQKRIDEEGEFYRKDPAKYPPALKRQVEEHQKAKAQYEGFLADREAEKKRVHARFDEDLVQLRRLWGGTPAAPVISVSASSPAPRK